MTRIINLIRIFLPRLSSVNAKIMPNVEPINTATRLDINFLLFQAKEFYISSFQIRVECLCKEGHTGPNCVQVKGHLDQCNVKITFALTP